MLSWYLEQQTGKGLSLSKTHPVIWGFRSNMEISGLFSSRETEIYGKTKMKKEKNPDWIENSGFADGIGRGASTISLKSNSVAGSLHRCPDTRFPFRPLPSPLQNFFSFYFFISLPGF